ncbi:hypothetical protein ER308_07315 [Egibacter rhizosphaerae]|uniref:Uncharacterized protein n=1 Tax=Egibacter rhizosphaerae TaxID=1670831 RepID=A0A411YDQ8_9ACTN|nr:hypothetical protein [Egibacter rhizosphaerae]QBI19374.1 hypothetical protein ER308_07315 [Egibacter rhizosphaerae]
MNKFPDFEGEEVHRGRIRVSGTGACHEPMHREDEIAIVMVGTVAEVAHKIHDKLLTRLHVIDPNEVYVTHPQRVGKTIAELRDEHQQLEDAEEGVERLPFPGDEEPRGGDPEQVTPQDLEGVVGVAEDAEADEEFEGADA